MTTFTSPRKRCARHIVWVVALIIVAASAEAWAQTSKATEWQRGTTLSGFGGAAALEGITPALGTALGWDVNPHVTIEGRGIWFPNDPGSTDFFAWLGALVPFRPGGAVVPYASAGIGMYRATVEAGTSNVPDFYESRLNGRTRATFEDFATAFGGGADVFVSSHFAIRPEVTVIVVTGGSDTRTVMMYGVNLAYHFESHKAP